MGERLDWAGSPASHMFSVREGTFWATTQQCAGEFSPLSGQSLKHFWSLVYFGLALTERTTGV
ncbi:hypothetical protein D2Q93_16710 [Alicyclobacillaceae bacterium I2511]|nr:hypothetical protein D2Q93_16710 [Alicyclobacillaceae bacterium I2511]